MAILVIAEHDNQSLKVSTRNTVAAAFDRAGILWFTGQAGVYGRLDPATGEMQVFSAPRGPYGIISTPDGSVYYAALASSHIARVDLPDSIQRHPCHRTLPLIVTRSAQGVG